MVSPLRAMQQQGSGPSIPRDTPALVGGRLAGGEPFDESQLEPLAPDDLEAFGADLAQRAAGEMLALQRHGDGFDGPLGGTDRPDGPAM